MTEFPFLGDLKDKTEIKWGNLHEFTIVSILQVFFVFCVMLHCCIFGVFVKEEVRKCFQLPLHKLLLDFSQGSTIFKF